MPERDSSDRQSFEDLCKAVGAISAFGSTATFAVIGRSLVKPGPGIEEEDLRGTVARAWVCFVLGLILSGYFIALHNLQPSLQNDHPELASCMSSILLLVVNAAFLQLAEFVRGYNHPCAIVLYVLFVIHYIVMAIILICTVLRDYLGRSIKYERRK